MPRIGAPHGIPVKNRPLTSAPGKPQNSAQIGKTMQSRATTVREYLAELPADRRAALETVRKVLRKNLDPLFEEGMQYGMIGYYVPHRVYPPGYHCDPRQPLPFAGLASQKNHMSVYLGCIYGPEREKAFREAWAKTGRKLDMGKACVRFRKIENLALDVIGEFVRNVSVRGFIKEYESVTGGLRKRPNRKRSSGRNRSGTQT